MRRKYIGVLMSFLLISVFMCGAGACEKKDKSLIEVQMHGNSMTPTINSEEILQAKLFEKGDVAERGDIIVLYVGNYSEYENLAEYIVKRLIAVEGDRVRCTDGQVEILYADAETWTPLTESYAYYTDRQAYDFAEYAVGEGEIFFLGDNRNNSIDSRYQEGFSHLDRLYTVDDIYAVAIA